MCEDGKEQGRPRNRTKSWEAGAQGERKTVGAGWSARWGRVTGCTFSSERKAKPRQSCKQGKRFAVLKDNSDFYMKNGLEEEQGIPVSSL